MYADTGLMFPSFPYLPQEIQQLEAFYCPQKPFASPLGSIGQISTISEYDLGGEGDLFKAPKPIIQDSVPFLDSMPSAVSMISCDDIISQTEALQVAGIESIQNDEQILSNMLCKSDLFSTEVTRTPFSEALDTKITFAWEDENCTAENKLPPPVQLPRSASSSCLSSMELAYGATPKPEFVKFSGIEFEAVYKIRRAFSEGDIKTLDNGIISNGQPQIISHCIPEDRKQKLLRYRNKRSKRNFGRKIKYACRKALADSQPRIRGRFARTEELDISKKRSSC